VTGAAGESGTRLIGRYGIDAKLFDWLLSVVDRLAERCLCCAIWWRVRYSRFAALTAANPRPYSHTEGSMAEQQTYLGDRAAAAHMASLATAIQ
jgi:hypothetical protein